MIAPTCLLAAALLLATECGGQPSTSQPKVSPMRSPDPGAQLYHTTNGPGGEPEQRVIRDKGAWTTAWTTLHAGLAAEPAPGVDFTRDMVVLVSIGQRPTGGYDVRVDGVSDAAQGGAVVHITQTRPGSGCMTTQALSAPVVAVRVPRADGAVRFDVRTVETPC